MGFINQLITGGAKWYNFSRKPIHWVFHNTMISQRQVPNRSSGEFTTHKIVPMLGSPSFKGGFKKKKHSINHWIHVVIFTYINKSAIHPIKSHVFLLNPPFSYSCPMVFPRCSYFFLSPTIPHQTSSPSDMMNGCSCALSNSHSPKQVREVLELKPLGWNKVSLNE